MPVAEIKRVAVVGWGHYADTLKDKDKTIAWLKEQKAAQQLRYIELLAERDREIKSLKAKLRKQT